MKRTHRAIVLGNALVWAAVLLAVTLQLQGTDHVASVLTAVGGGAAASLLVVVGGLRRLS